MKKKIWLVDVKNILLIPLGQNGMEGFVEWRLIRKDFFRIPHGVGITFGNSLRRSDCTDSGRPRPV